MTASQATGLLAPNQRVRRGDPGRLGLVLGGLHPEVRQSAEAIVDAVSGEDQLTLVDLIAKVTGGGRSQQEAARRVAEASRLLVRLLNLGIIELSQRSAD